MSHEIIQAIKKLNVLKHGGSRTFGTLASFAVGGLLAALDLVDEIVIEGKVANIQEDVDSFVRLRRQEDTTTDAFSTTETTTNFETLTPTTDPSLIQTTTVLYNYLQTTLKYASLEVLRENEQNSTKVRQPRQDENDADNEVDSGDKKKLEEEEKEDEGPGGGLLGAIISGFLGSLSNPDGGVDVNAVISVIGSLSAMKEDGTYDFTGLTDTLGAFFGGGDEDGGGSDVGSFAGGVLAAAIAGIASPPGAKGAGAFVGKLLKQVLPALSGPINPEEGGAPGKPPASAGGFVWGLLSALFGGPNTGSNGSQPISPFYTIKVNLIKYIFSVISSIIATSSASKTEHH